MVLLLPFYRPSYLVTILVTLLTWPMMLSSEPSTLGCCGPSAAW